MASLAGCYAGQRSEWMVGMGRAAPGGPTDTREKHVPMDETSDTLQQRLKETTSAFYESNLRCTPREVEVLRQQDFIVIRVRGFLTKAEIELSQQPQEAKLLTDYYSGMLEGLYLPLEAVVRDMEHCALVDKQVVLEIDQEQCVFLLTLGTKPTA